MKEKGNDAFKKKKYEVAEKFYSEALQLNLDSRPIWTNRAVCRNTMGKHEEALTDSISALSIDAKCTKFGFQIVSSPTDFSLTVHFENLSSQSLKKETHIWVWVNMRKPKSVTNLCVNMEKILPLIFT